MAIKLTTTRQAALLNGVKVLVYGKAGHGKTRLCETAPQPIIISAEAGLLSLRHTDIPVIEIATIQDLDDALAWAKDSAESKQFWTICVDSISEIGEVVLSNAKKSSKDPRQAYGELIDKMGTIIRGFRDLPGKHVYISAKQEVIKDDFSGLSTYGPGMPGSKMGPAMPYFFDEVFRLGIGKLQDGSEYRFLQTRPDMQYDAKDRSGCLDMLEPPDLSGVFNKIIAGALPPSQA